MNILKITMQIKIQILILVKMKSNHNFQGYNTYSEKNEKMKVLLDLLVQAAVKRRQGDKELSRIIEGQNDYNPELKL